MTPVGQKVFSWLLALVRGADKPVVAGLSAPQGAGKTTLAGALLAAFAEQGLRAVSISIDDFYLTRAEQLALAAAHPGDRLLEHRGYPGTHDLELGTRTLSALREGRAVDLPRYDKSAHGGRGDRSPVVERVVGPVDLVLFDGWMLGFEPAASVPAELRLVNEKLGAYQAWHSLIDVMVWLRADDPRFVIEWRSEAEETARRAGKAALSRAEIEDYARRFIPAYETWSVRGPWPTLELHIRRDRTMSLWQPTLTGALLRLRPLHEDDWPALSSAASDPLIWEQHPEPTRWKPEVFRTYFESGLACHGALVVEDLRTGAVIGSSRFCEHREDTRSVEIGYTFLTRPSWGGAHNTEMKALMMRHAFTLVDSVWFVVGESNRRSRRAVEKLGGLLRPRASAPLEGEFDGKVIYRVEKPATAALR